MPADPTTLELLREASDVIRKMDEHEGAEGWSSDLRAKIDNVCARIDAHLSASEGVKWLEWRKPYPEKDATLQERLIADGLDVSVWLSPCTGRWHWSFVFRPTLRLLRCGNCATEAEAKAAAELAAGVSR